MSCLNMLPSHTEIRKQALGVRGMLTCLMALSFAGLFPGLHYKDKVFLLKLSLTSSVFSNKKRNKFYNMVAILF